MDPLTHLTAGGLSGQAVRNPFRDPGILLFCILASVLPDIDNFISIVGPECYLRYHRGITHSVFGSLVLAALLAGLFRLFIKRFAVRRSILIAYVIMIVHIFQDLITSYGTQILSPFTNTRYQVACVFIIDPLYTLSLAFLLYLSFRTPLRRRRRRIAIIGLCWLLTYPMINLGIRQVIHHTVASRLQSAEVSYHNLHVSPDAFAPLFWKIIVEHDATYQLGGFSLFHPTRSLKWEEYVKADRNQLQRFGQQESMFATYDWFTDFTVVREKEVENGERALIFSDLRFGSTLDFLQKRMQRDGGSPFELTAIVDAQGHLLRYVYQQPGRATAAQPAE